MDAKGWYWQEKLEIRLSWWLFLAVDAWLHAWCWVTRGRVNGLDSKVWLDLLSAGYLHSDMARGDMPEHHRIGGVWR